MIDGFRLNGEIAVVAGASGNLGPVWIETLLDAGAAVFAIDRPDARSPGSSLVDAELMTKREDPSLHGGARSELIPDERCDE